MLAWLFGLLVTQSTPYAPAKTQEASAFTCRAVVKFNVRAESSETWHHMMHQGAQIMSMSCFGIKCIFPPNGPVT